KMRSRRRSLAKAGHPTLELAQARVQRIERASQALELRARNEHSVLARERLGGRCREPPRGVALPRDEVASRLRQPVRCDAADGPRELLLDIPAQLARRGPDGFGGCACARDAEPVRTQ